MKTAICTLEGVVKKYGSATALGPISLEVYSGEALGIRGLNGAGKSTLIKLMAGVLSPDAGTIRRCSGSIGYVPQEIALYPGLSGKDNLRFWADVAGLDHRAKKARVRWLLEQTQLSEHADKKLGAYSGGMQRRLNLAAALVVTPELLLLDEPLAGVDSLSALAIVQMLRNLRDKGCAVVIVSHTDDALSGICDRVVELPGPCVPGVPNRCDEGLS